MNVKSEAPKTTVKAPETKAVETKAAVKAAAPAAAPKAEPKKAEAPAAEKKPVAKAVKPVAEKKAAPKKAAETTKTKPGRKPSVKAKKEVKSSVYIEYAGKQIVAKNILAAAEKAYAKINKDAVIKTIEVYVKPEENAAYYVVNGEGSDQYKVLL